MTGRQQASGPRWALPPRPPDSWIGGVWSAALVVGLLLAVAVPVVSAEGDTASRSLTRTALAVLTAAAALIAAHSLLIEHSVRGDRRLQWAAAGFAGGYGVLLLRSTVSDADRVGALTVVVLVALPLSVLVSRLEGSRLRLLGPAAIVVALAAAAVLTGTPPDRVRWGAVCFLSLLALGVWRSRSGPALWVSVSLVLAAGAALLAGRNGAPYSDSWWVAVSVEAAAFVLPAIGVGFGALAGYGRQSRRWRQLETEVRAQRTGSPLLPGRAVTPDDDEGLPGKGEVRLLVDAARLRVAIQPVLELESGTVVGHEALSRFGGRVPTDRWFKAASLYGLGGELERVTLTEALTLLSTLPQHEFLAVNVSPAALSDKQVLALLDAADLSRVVIEITEHEAVADYAVTRAALGRLRRAGARIAVDDTGAGFASLRHVLMLQPDLIKLDTSLTRGIETDKRQQALVRAVTQFAAQVGADVLAEGIEEQGQLDALREIGVPLGQGWHLGVPVIVT